MEQTLNALAERLKGRVIGDGSILIRDVSSLEDVGEGTLTFAQDARHLARALESKAGAILVSAGITKLEGRSGISVQDPKLAFALLLDLFHPAIVSQEGLHPSAVVGEGVEFGAQVSVRAQAVLGDRVRIGQGTVIEPGARIGNEVTIGRQCLVGPNVVIYRQTVIGDRVAIHGGSVIGGDGFGYVFHDGRHVKVPQVGNVVIEDDVEIGCNVCVDRATIGSTLIRRGTKIDNLVQIGHNDRIGQHVIITGQGGFSGSVTVGDYAVFGGRAGIKDHVTIGAGAQVGLCAVVTKSVAPGEVVWGYPARAMRTTLQQMASLSRLPSLFKLFSAFAARLTRLEERLDRDTPRA